MILLLSTENYSDGVRFVCGLGGEMFLRMWCVFIQGGEGHDESPLPSLFSILFQLSLSTPLFSFTNPRCIVLVGSVNFYVLCSSSLCTFLSTFRAFPSLLNFILTGDPAFLL